MKSDLTKVMHKKEVVGEIDVPVYENLTELMENETEAQIVTLFNKMNKIRLQAAERVKHTEGRIGKGKARASAFNLLTTEEIVRYAGKFEDLQKFLDSEEMQARVAANQ